MYGLQRFSGSKFFPLHSSLLNSLILDMTEDFFKLKQDAIDLLRKRLTEDVRKRLAEVDELDVAKELVKIKE